MSNLDAVQKRINTYLEHNAPTQLFHYKFVSKGIFGTSLFPREEAIEIYWQPNRQSSARIKVAEVGRFTKPQISPYDRTPLDPFFAAVCTEAVEDPNKPGERKHIPLYDPDKTRENGSRVFSESKLAKIARSEPLK